MSASPRKRTRLDLLLVQRELADSRTEAQRLVMAEQVTVNGQKATKAGAQVPYDAQVTVLSRQPYASRGGLKLAAALDYFDTPVSGLVAADVGASTGGFTDCLLQRGVSKVYAIDVGYGQLAWSLRQDARVVVMERTNARFLDHLPEVIHLATVDVSFISLELILPRVYNWLAPGGLIVALIKPQFEAGRSQVGKGGVVRDRAVHQQVLYRVLGWCIGHGLPVHGLARSPITGPAGNVEFLALLGKSSPLPAIDLTAAIEAVLATGVDRSPDPL
jgi:23S rRNA (cytidine1920-2'-O)/16S rRNA (cytidine1409-2'-O)-methyltransferase